MGCKVVNCSAQALAPHGRAQVLVAYPVPFLAQRHVQPTGAIAAFVVPKHLCQGGFSGRYFLPHRPLRALLPGVKSTGRHTQHLAEPPHEVYLSHSTAMKR